MKKVVFLLVFAVLMFSLVLLVSVVAQQGQGQQVQAGESDNESGDTGVQQNQEQSSQTSTEVRGRLTKGNEEEIKTEQGERVMLKLKENNRIQIRVGNNSAECSCNLTEEKIQNRTRLNVRLSNGLNSEIKIMPDVASETALERLRLKVCSSENNCSIELKEVAVERYENNKYYQARVAYEVRAEKQSKIFGLFNKKMHVQAQVDAANGEVVALKKSWWAFLASEQEE